MTNRTQIKVAVIGCGRIAGHHCRSIAQVQGIELVGVCDLVLDKALAYGKEFSVPYFTNYRKMLEELPEINTVAVITPSGMHYEHGLEILERYKKNIIVEKPTFLKSSQLEKAYEIAEKNGLNLFPVFQNRYNKAVQRVKTAIQNNELGKLRIISVRVRWCRPQRYYELAPWRGTFAQDGGALTNQGIHHLDLMRYLGGEISEVNATMRTLGANIEVEDTVVGSVKFKNGETIGALEVTTAARPIDFEASISIVAEKGLAQIGGIAVNELQVFTPNPGDCAINSEDFSGCVYGYGHQALYRDISAFFHGKIPYPVNKFDALGTICLLQAFYRSDEAGTWVQANSVDESHRLGRPNEKLANLYRTPYHTSYHISPASLGAHPDKKATPS
ncbi:Gfo/Idh/MocA family oxidoreductase [Candidatus Nomurabacteria bacterium]|nr:Gfo/Idh/MocA family oxidoreductase [Candidatus Nomurabacteria bacterium]